MEGDKPVFTTEQGSLFTPPPKASRNGGATTVHSPPISPRGEGQPDTAICNNESTHQNGNEGSAMPVSPHSSPRSPLNSAVSGLMNGHGAESNDKQYQSPAELLSPEQCRQLEANRKRLEHERLQLQQMGVMI